MELVLNTSGNASLDGAKMLCAESDAEGDERRGGRLNAVRFPKGTSKSGKQHQTERPFNPPRTTST